MSGAYVMLTGTVNFATVEKKLVTVIRFWRHTGRSRGGLSIKPGMYTEAGSQRITSRFLSRGKPF